MTTEEELERLQDEGTPPETRLWVAHYFSHFGSSEPERGAFREALRANGFGTPGKFTEIGSDEEIEGDGYWHHYAFTALSASRSELLRFDGLAQQLALAGGAEYDGWRVERNHVTGEVRLANDD